jgi:hypothetical protein
VLLTDRAKAFAELGKVWLASLVGSFAEPIAIFDSDVAGDVRSLLEDEVGDLERVFELTLDPDTDTLKGKADQRVSLSRIRTYGFTITPDRIVYKVVSSPVGFGESDEDWGDLVEFVARSGKKLNCRPGNMQCGGKCQKETLNCYHGMSPEQKKKAQSVVRKAKAAAIKAGTLKPSETNSIAPKTSTPKAAQDAGVTPKSGAKMFDGHTIGIKSRVTQAALENALDSIPTSGAAERVEKFRSFVNKHEVQAAFWDEEAPGYLAQAKTIAKGVKNYDFINDDRYRYWQESKGVVIAGGRVREKINREHPDFFKAISPSVTPLDGANGHTIQIANHVFVNIREGKSGRFSPDARDLGATIQSAITAHEFELPRHSISSIAVDPDTATLSTYLHEVGHQVLFKADSARMVIYPDDTKTLTSYANTNNDEWFAEHFAAWVLDGESYKAFDPIGHKFIEDTLELAAQSKKK